MIRPLYKSVEPFMEVKRLENGRFTMSDTSSPFKGSYRPGRHNPKRKKKLLKDDMIPSPIELSRLRKKGRRGDPVTGRRR